MTFRNDASTRAFAWYFRHAAECRDTVPFANSGIEAGESKTILLDLEGDFSFSFDTFQKNVSGGVGIVGQAIYDLVDKPCPNRIDTFALEPGHEYVVFETRTPKTASSECELHVVDLVPQPDGSVHEVPIDLRPRKVKGFAWASDPVCEPEDAPQQESESQPEVEAP